MPAVGWKPKKKKPNPLKNLRCSQYPLESVLSMPHSVPKQDKDYEQICTCGPFYTLWLGILNMWGSASKTLPSRGIRRLLVLALMPHALSHCLNSSLVALLDPLAVLRPCRPRTGVSPLHVTVRRERAHAAMTVINSRVLAILSISCQNPTFFHASDSPTWSLTMRIKKTSHQY